MSDRAALSLELPDHVLDELAARVAERLAGQQRPGPERWAGVAEVAEHLGIARQGVYDRAHAAATTGFPVHRDGSRLIFKLTEVDQWLAEPEAK